MPITNTSIGISGVGSRALTVPVPKPQGSEHSPIIYGAGLAHPHVNQPKPPVASEPVAAQAVEDKAAHDTEIPEKSKLVEDKKKAKLKVSKSEQVEE
jgi:hypothetical protein